MTPLDGAWLCAAGWRRPVLPIHPMRGGACSCARGSACRSPGKHPIATLVPDGLKSATLDIRTIVAWWAEWPDANVAVAMGAGLFALDVDPRHGGDAALHELVQAHGRLPPTVTARTGGGGWHFLFLWPPGLPTRKDISAGLETKSEGGYIVAAPSLHASGSTYRWIRSPVDIPPAEPPRWLAELAVARPDPPVAVSRDRPQPLSIVERAARYMDRCAPAISGQGGHSTTLLVAEHLVRGFELSEGQALDLLRVWNRACEPPWSEKELVRKIREAASRGKTVAIGAHTAERR